MDGSFAAGPAPSRRRWHRSKVIATFTSVLVVTGIAWAAWTTAGSGFGRSRAGAMQALTITPDDVTIVCTSGPGDDGCLYPGGSGDVAFTVTNPNTRFAVDLSALASSGPITLAGGGDATACAVSVNAAALSGFTGSVAAGASEDFLVADAVSMGGGADNSCQGADFDVPLTLTATSA